MKRFATLLALVATLTTSAGFAQNGKGAAASSSSANDFAWGIGIAGVAVIATVVGVTAAAAASSPSSFNH